LANATIFHLSVFFSAGVTGAGSVNSAPTDATAPEPPPAGVAAAAAAAAEGGCWGMVAVRCPPAVTIVVAAPAWPTGCVAVLAVWLERAPAVAIVGGAAGAPAGRRHQSPSFRASHQSSLVLVLVAVLVVLVPSPRAAAAAPAAPPRTSPDNPCTVAAAATTCDVKRRERAAEAGVAQQPDARGEGFGWTCKGVLSGFSICVDGT